MWVRVMSFKKILDKLVERSGALGAVMVAGDGEVVEASGLNGSSELGEGLELDFVGAHYAVVLDLLAGVAEQSPELDPVETVTVSTGRARLAVTALKEGYMVVVLMGRAVSSARAAYESRNAVKMIELEMG